VPRAGTAETTGSDLQVEIAETGPACVGISKQILFKLSNNSTKPVEGIIITAAFSRELEHETRANPVEMVLPPLAPAEKKEIPLFLTPSKVGEYELTLNVRAADHLATSKQAKMKVQPRPTEQPIPYARLAPGAMEANPTSLARHQAFSFVQATARGRNVHVDGELQVTYVAKSINQQAPDGTTQTAWYYEPVTKPATRTIAAAQIRAMRADGKRLSGGELLEALKEPTLVLKLHEGERVDPFVLALFKAETLILTLPPLPPQTAPPTTESAASPKPRAAKTKKELPAK
jgi:hypothetical protein